MERNDTLHGKINLREPSLANFVNQHLQISATSSLQGAFIIMFSPWENSFEAHGPGGEQICGNATKSYCALHPLSESESEAKYERPTLLVCM